MLRNAFCAAAVLLALPMLPAACGSDDSKDSAKLGTPCAATSECDQSASDLGVFCCTDPSCGKYQGKCVEVCDMYSSGGVPGDTEGMDCKDNTECADGLFCCLSPGSNCDFALDQSCTCRTGSK